MIDIKSFSCDHLEVFEPKGQFEDLHRDMERNLLDISKTILTIFFGSRVLAIVGVTKFREGVGEVWLLPSVHVDEHKISFYKTVKSLIYNFVFPKMNFHRLEIAILKGWEKGMKWAKSLGFKESHTCEAYDTHMRDHVIFYRIEQWQKAQR